MAKRIYQIADLHIPPYKRIEMYSEQLNRIVSMISEDFAKSGLDESEVRIVICGDLVDSKNLVTNELNITASKFIRNLSNIAKVICIAGNHDLIESNTARIDTLTGLFETAEFSNAVFADMILNYESGIIVDDNIVWALYSFYDNFNRPDIEIARAENPDNTVIGLFHGMIVGSKLYNGFVADVGSNKKIFKGCDFVLAGHIHKRQEIKNGSCKIVYSGSPIQKDYGEPITQHGYAVWDVENKSYEFVDVPSEYGYYDFMIKSIDDFDNDKEKLVNL